MPHTSHKHTHTHTPHLLGPRRIARSTRVVADHSPHLHHKRTRTRTHIHARSSASRSRGRWRDAPLQRPTSNGSLRARTRVGVVGYISFFVPRRRAPPRRIALDCAWLQGGGNPPCWFSFEWSWEMGLFPGAAKILFARKKKRERLRVLCFGGVFVFWGCFRAVLLRPRAEFFIGWQHTLQVGR